MTSQKLYSLTDQTVDYVKNMQDDVTIYVLVNQDNQDTTLGQTYRDMMICRIISPWNMWILPLTRCSIPVHHRQHQHEQPDRGQRQAQQGH